MRRGKWRARKLRNTGCCMERKCGDPKVDFRKQLDRVRQKGLLVWITYKDGSKGKFSWNTDKKKSSAYRQPLAMSDRGRKGFHIFSRATKNWHMRWAERGGRVAPEGSAMCMWILVNEKLSNFFRASSWRIASMHGRCVRAYPRAWFIAVKKMTRKKREHSKGKKGG